MASTASNNERSEHKRPEKDMDIMHRGDCVILKDESGKYRHHTIGSKTKEMVNGISSMLEHKPYGSVFEVGGCGEEQRIEECSDWQSLRDETSLDDEHVEVRDNSSLHHLTANQVLTQKEIERMKSSKSRKEDDKDKDNDIVSVIASSSKTFLLKTEFSKEKYLKNKRKKHKNPKYVSLKANSSFLTEMYFERKPDKTMGVRIDTVSQILCIANVHHSCSVLCSESMNGLLIGSIAERMGGFGRIYSIHCERNPLKEIVESMSHLTDAQMELVQNVNIGLFSDPLWTTDSLQNDEKLKAIKDAHSKHKRFKDSRPSLY